MHEKAPSLGMRHNFLHADDGIAVNSGAAIAKEIADITIEPSALLHNISTLGLAAGSMTNLIKK